jgi:hypothetical protein
MGYLEDKTLPTDKLPSFFKGLVHSRNTAPRATDAQPIAPPTPLLRIYLSGI